MLPNIRVILGAIVAAIGLMTISFGLVAAFRVAQDTRIGVLQADLAQRGRSFIPASQESRPALPVERPAPLEAIPVRAVEIQEAPEIPKEIPETPLAVVLAVPQSEPPVTELPVTELPVPELPVPERLMTEVPAIKPPSAEPPMGGPLPDEAANRSEPPAPKAVDDVAAKMAKKKAAQAAAKKKRAQRLARERKAAARKARAAQARAQQQQSASSFDNAPLGNSFGTFNNGTSANSPFGNGTFGNGTFGTSASGR